MFVIFLKKYVFDGFFQQPSILASIFHARKARVFEQVGSLDDFLAEGFPIRRAGHCKVYVLAVAGKVWSIRRHVVVAHADPRGFFAGVPEMMWKITEPRDDGIEHGYVDQLSLAGFLTLVKRQQNAERSVHTGCDVGNGDTGASRLVGIPSGGDDAAFALNEQVVRLHVTIGTVLTVAGQRAVNQPSIKLA